MPLSTRRHSLSHVMAQATRMVMGASAKLAIWPDIDNGWYYDIDFGDATLEESKLRDIEKKMKAIIREGQEFQQFSLSVADAKIFTKSLGEDYKLEMIEDLESKGETMISFFANIGKFQNPTYANFAFLDKPQIFSKEENGEIIVTKEASGSSGFNFQHSTFIDMCQWPHVANTNMIPEESFKIDKLAWAYWRGDEKNKQLTRIYGLAFETGEDLEKYEYMMEESKKRDHRLLGEKLDLFTFDESIGKWLPIWLPKWTIVKEELEKWAKETETEWWYDRVSTPIITKEDLFYTSWHLPLYKESMYSPIQIEDENYYIKPMNCPFHHRTYAARPKSYRQLPVRYAEYGWCHRYEDSGSLFGLMRVRGMQMNDAHIYVQREKAVEEFVRVIKLHEYYYKILGITKYEMELALRDPNKMEKYHGDEEDWKEAERMTIEAMELSWVPYKVVNEWAAFYGPKMDFQITSSIGRSFTASTNQLDLYMGKKFGLKYVDIDGKEKVPAIIHRAPLGTHERFIGFLIEHFAGVFPLWLAPEQVRIIPVGEAFTEYANAVKKTLSLANIRVSVNDSSDSLGKKIRNAETEHVNYILVVGEQEAQSGGLAVRNYKTQLQSHENTGEFLMRIQEEIAQKAL